MTAAAPTPMPGPIQAPAAAPSPTPALAAAPRPRTPSDPAPDNDNSEETGPDTASPSSWINSREVGSRLGMGFLVLVSRLLGRAPARALLWVVSFYYVVLSARVRRVSRDYLRRVGEKPSFRNVYLHILTFARVALDRLFLLRGQTERFSVERTGHDHLAQLKENGQGALLIGAHIGSFEAMRAMSRDFDIPLNIVGYFHNARLINEMLARAGDNTTTRFIDAGAPPMALALRLKEAVDRGELVAILADRAGIGRHVPARFLGEVVELPAGWPPLASALRCPVLMTTGLYLGGNRYHLFCEPLAQKVVLPRGRRDEAIGEYVQAYADQLERWVQEAPYNWFNFYDYWGTAG